MTRKTSSSNGRHGSHGGATLAHVDENENESDDAASPSHARHGSGHANAAAHLFEMERLEQERVERFQAAEKELLSVLEADGITEHVRKRQLTRLFDRFRLEYTQLSGRFRETLRMQRKIMDKCLEMKNELVVSALKIKTAKQMQEEEMKNLIYYRDECEHAWKATKVCEEREKDAMRIIDELKGEIEDLHAQVKTLLHVHSDNAAVSVSAAHITTAAAAGPNGGLTPVRSPSKRTLPIAPLSPTRTHAVVHDAFVSPHFLSFDEWKASTRVWSGAPERGKAATPSQDELFTMVRKQEIARCVSVPSLQPTAMERASTAAAAVSPTRRKERTPDTDARRAVTAVSNKRIPPSLPTVTTRKAP